MVYFETMEVGDTIVTHYGYTYRIAAIRKKRPCWWKPWQVVLVVDWESV